jgi:Fe-S cluster assembly iron-binding protein IscA
MLKVTNKAVTALKATARSKEGVSEDAGIRIRRDAVAREPGIIRVGFDICDGPEAGDAELEQNGLRIFVEDALRKPLEDRTLDVRNEEAKPEFVFV